MRMPDLILAKNGTDVNNVCAFFATNLGEWNMKAEDRRRQVLTAISVFVAQHGYPPSYRQIETMIDLAWSSVGGYVNQLAQDGYLTMTPGVGRTIRLTERGQALVRDEAA